ncbi:MAG: diacylglycerol kinase family protein [Calditrichaceae bacterium]
MNNYYFIVNPASGRGKGKVLGGRLRQKLIDLGLDHELVFTEKKWHAVDLAAKAADKFKIVVAVGGDGTVHEVVNGLVGTKAVFGVIPVGSGNDFVHAAGIPNDFNQALDLLLAGNQKFIDVGKANDRYFPNGLGVGFDAWVVNTSFSVTKLRGNAIYLYSVLRNLITYKPVEIEIRYNGTVRTEDFFMLTFGNGVSMGGGFHLTPDAVLDDGLIDLCLVKNMSLIAKLKNLLLVYSGKHKDDPKVTMARADKVQLRSETGFAVHADGELMSLNMQELNIEIIPNALRIIS